MKSFVTGKNNISKCVRNVSGNARTLSTGASTSDLHQRQDRSLTHAHLLDTASILKPQWRHLAVCWGAAWHGSPMLGNVYRLGLDPLSTKMFWQSHRDNTPLQLSRNKSGAVAHLTPSLMGVLWMASSLSLKEQRQVLRDHGIKSNYINTDQWIGVSLKRWTDLMETLACPVDTASPRNGVPALVGSTPWLVGLWEIARTKHDLLDFILAMENFPNASTGQTRFMDDSNEMARALLHDETARNEWARSSFQAEELTPDRVHDALELLLHSNNNRSSDLGSPEEARALEIICASRAISHMSQPIVPNGRYGYDGADPKPDCVEVNVRELFNLLLWDESQSGGGGWDLSRLPPSTRTELRQLYSPHRNQEPLGQAWFNVLSNKDGCDYLSSSPNGKPYELTPTLGNVSRVAQQLMGFDNGTEEWTSLEDLAARWNSRQDGQPMLNVTSRKSSHRAAMSDELLHHEHATLHLAGSKHGIEMKMDKAHGISTVSHIRLQTDRVEPALLGRLRVRAAESNSPVVWSLLALCLQGDYGLQGEECNDKHPNCSLLDVLAAPYGPDRRDLMQLAGTSDLEMESKAHEQALRASRNVLSEAVGQVCRLPPSEQKIALLAWLLKEKIGVVEEHDGQAVAHDPTVEKLLLTLPLSTLAELPLEQNQWACRGPVLSRLVQFKLGNMTIQELLKSSGVGEVMAQLSLYPRLPSS